MRVLFCDECKEEIQGRVYYVEAYYQENENDNESSKPAMPMRELCPMCMDSLKNHFNTACMADRGGKK